MGNALTIREQRELADELAKSRLLPSVYVGNSENVFVAIEYGKELGLPPMEAITSINVIQGRPTMSANLMAALVRRAGCKLRITQHGKGDEAAVQATLIRPDDPDFGFAVVWNKERAVRAGVWGSKAWAYYPEQMLRNRAITEVCRMGASDFLMGVIYDAEELGAAESMPSEPATVAEVEIVADDASETVESGEQGGAVFDGEVSGAAIAVFDTAEQLGYDADRLAAACSWASSGRTQLPDELSEDEAQTLVRQMRHMAMSDKWGEQA